jgi:hypothetical protein
MDIATATRIVPSSEYGVRTEDVTHFVAHHAATTSLPGLENLMGAGGRTVSAHWAIKNNDRVRKVPLKFRAFSLASKYWDSKAVTAECVNESTNGWTISPETAESLAMCIAEAAQEFDFYPHRNGHPSTWTVLGHREVYTIHKASYATACPGAMDLDAITRRAQEILGGAAPKPPVVSPTQPARPKLFTTTVYDGKPGPIYYEMVQRIGTRLGIYDGLIDGIPGPKTYRAEVMLLARFLNSLQLGRTTDAASNGEPYNGHAGNFSNYVWLGQRYGDIINNYAGIVDGIDGPLSKASRARTLAGWMNRNI